MRDPRKVVAAVATVTSIVIVGAWIRRRDRDQSTEYGGLSPSEIAEQQRVEAVESMREDATRRLDAIEQIERTHGIDEDVTRPMKAHAEWQRQFAERTDPRGEDR